MKGRFFKIQVDLLETILKQFNALGYLYDERGSGVPIRDWYDHVMEMDYKDPVLQIDLHDGGNHLRITSETYLNATKNQRQIFGWDVFQQIFPDIILNETEHYLLNISEPILRKLMTEEEIKVANRLVKEGLMGKGISEDRQKTVTYYPL
tara:strand:- start:14 stop:463 length:450 start_codon:yes stop_codon:yes gene_type:complete